MGEDWHCGALGLWQPPGAGWAAQHGAHTQGWVTLPGAPLWTTGLWRNRLPANMESFLLPRLTMSQFRIYIWVERDCFDPKVVYLRYNKAGDREKVKQEGQIRGKQSVSAASTKERPNKAPGPALHWAAALLEQKRCGWAGKKWVRSEEHRKGQWSGLHSCASKWAPLAPSPGPWHFSSWKPGSAAAFSLASTLPSATGSWELWAGEAKCTPFPLVWEALTHLLPSQPIGCGSSGLSPGEAKGLACDCRGSWQQSRELLLTLGKPSEQCTVLP